MAKNVARRRRKRVLYTGSAKRRRSPVTENSKKQNKKGREATLLARITINILQLARAVHAR